MNSKQSKSSKQRQLRPQQPMFNSGPWLHVTIHSLFSIDCHSPVVSVNKVKKKKKKVSTDKISIRGSAVATECTAQEVCRCKMSD